jgi:aquaporin Z
MQSPTISTWGRWRRHLPEYLIEAFCLGAFMVSAGLVATAFNYPGSVLHRAVTDDTVRRACIGVAMGLTAVALIYSPWGKRSGAHMNPAVTLSFLRLGRIRAEDAVAYIVMQFAGGILGVLVARAIAGAAFTAPPVSWVATLPGRHGEAAAFAAEALISGGLMWVVLNSAASPRSSRYTGLFAGLLVATYITFEAPLSGMSMNPARSFASAAPAMLWSGFWIYLLAPPLGMLTATECFRLTRSERPCAKLMHTPRERCIHCGHVPTAAEGEAAPSIDSHSLRSVSS